MLPLYLSIEGLYSYQGKQEIDFTRLTEAGLFGIFGSVGSGKSSILEAISFALYGDTERLHKLDKRSYNMLNLKSNSTQIVFDFLNFEQRKFRFVAQWKRRKRFEDISSIERLAYEWKDGQWLPMESADGALVTNLSYPNFRRTIIIPQGKFKEFLELGGKDRSEMMKEIFHLSKYDLGPKVSFLQGDNNKKVEHLKGALSGFEEVTPELIALKQQEVNDAKQNLSTVKNEYQIVEGQFQRLADLQQSHSLLATKKAEFKLVEEQSAHIKQIESELQQFEQTLLHFKEPINNLRQLTIAKENLVKKIELLNEQKTSLSKELKENEEKLNQLLPDYNNIDKFKNQIEDYKILIQNVELDTQKKEQQDRLLKGQPLLEKVRQKQIELCKQIEEEEAQLEKLKNERMDTSEILAIENWYQSKENLTKSLDELSLKHKTNENQITELLHSFVDAQLHVQSWEQDLQSQLTQQQHQLKKLDKEEADSRLKEELSLYVHNLVDGEACPLCGALEHPAPMHIHDRTGYLKDILAQKSVIESEVSLLHKKNQEFTVKATLLADKKQVTVHLGSEIAAQQQSLDQLLKSFKWSTFSSEDKSIFTQKKQEIQHLENQLKAGDVSLKQLREDLVVVQKNAIAYEKEISRIEQEIHALEANIKQNSNQLRVLNLYELIGIEPAQFPSILSTLLAKVSNTEQNYELLRQQINELNTSIASLAGQHTENYAQYGIVNEQITVIQTAINLLLTEHHYSDLGAVQVILNKNLPIDQYRRNIQQHQIQLSTLHNRIIELQLLVENKEYSEQIFTDTQTLFQLKKEELELQLSLTGAVEKEYERIQKEFEKKSKLVAEFEKLTARRDNLEVLARMFKGNGFVNYVSTIHLQRLCEIANQRFHRLTKNQLSLRVNEANEFEVLDYLNNGYSRSVKTLSGGQGFQASLCLALALAENIQALNKADKNFFFIDEGFGTQDTESMNTVFDTLQYLHQENRVVGIISHVEELKERIPRSITVVNDIEKGSQITTQY